MSRTFSHTYGYQTTFRGRKKFRRDRLSINEKQYDKLAKQDKFSGRNSCHDIDDYYLYRGWNASLNGYINALLNKFCDKKYSEFKRIVWLKAKKMNISINQLNTEIFHTFFDNSCLYQQAFKKFNFYLTDSGHIFAKMFDQDSEEVAMIPQYRPYNWRERYRDKDMNIIFYVDSTGFIRKKKISFKELYSLDCESIKVVSSWEVWI